MSPSGAGARSHGPRRPPRVRPGASQRHRQPLTAPTVDEPGESGLFDDPLEDHAGRQLPGVAASSATSKTDDRREGKGESSGRMNQAWRRIAGVIAPLAVKRQQSTEIIRPTRGDNVVSTGLEERLEEKRLAQWTRKKKRIRDAAIVTVVIAILAWLLLASPLLGLRMSDVNVSGSDGSVNPEEVTELVQPYAGTSLIMLDVNGVGQKVADSLVRVQDATVRRNWPHGITVVLTMRTPVVAMKVGETYQIMDAHAVVLETAPAPMSGTVTITAPEGGQSLTEEQVLAVSQAVGALNPSTRSRVASAAISSAGMISLTLDGGQRVVWGSSDDNDFKAEVLGVLITREAHVYDVSAPNNPTTS